MRTSIALAAAALAPSVLGHFILQYPKSLGFDDDIEGTGPCGGFEITFNGTEDSLEVGAFAVSMLSTHPQAEWLFRATLSTAAPFNWTNLMPVVDETGLGQFCIPTLSAPAEFAGQKGVLQVIQNAADGLLYQCAAVNFVQGSNRTIGPTCTNSTGLTARVSTEGTFNNASISNTTTSTASASSASSTAKSSNIAALGAVPTELLGSILAVAPVALLLA